MSGALEPLLVKIASGDSLSGEIDLRSRRLVAIVAPTGWTAARLTLASRPTDEDKAVGGTVVTAPAAGVGLGGMVDSAGALVVVATDTALQSAGAMIALSGVIKEQAACAAIVKLRSTNTASAAAVTQGADRYLWLLLEARSL